MPYEPPAPEQSPGAEDRTAVLLVNLGSPNSPAVRDVRRYLKEFLSDPRVVNFPRILWWLILNGIILNTRPRKTARKYAAIWTPEGSPLLIHTEKQAKLLRGYLGHSGHKLHVSYAMRYGQPALVKALNRLHKKGVGRILLLPLYPQYSTSTTASVLDAAHAWAKQLQQPPKIRAVKSFHDHPGYIKALAASVRQHWKTHGRPGSSYRLVMSFHGTPRAMAERGDPYRDECLVTARLLAQALNLSTANYCLCFQSRFGPAEWLQPYTATTLAELGQQGVRRVDVLCPGFPADCLETLEEIAELGKSIFLQAGGQEFAYIPALNEREEWIRALMELTLEHLQR